jgi:hypothetical protein
VSVVKPSRVNGILVQSSILPDMIVFEQHKDALLSNLRETFERSPRSKPLDTIKLSRDLTVLAKWYFEEKKKQKPMPAADYAKRLHKLATAFGSAHAIADKALRDGFVYDLASEWIAETNVPLASAISNGIGVRRIAAIKNAVGNLVVLERLARRAANNVLTRRGPRKGTSILPTNYIHALAFVFKVNTGRRPSRVEGPFARFVREFLAAIGQGDRLSKKYVVEMIKEARAEIRKDPSRWALSAFNS